MAAASELSTRAGPRLSRLSTAVAVVLKMTLTSLLRLSRELLATAILAVPVPPGTGLEPAYFGRSQW